MTAVIAGPSPAALMPGLRDAIAQGLRPHVQEIDAQGLYPRAFMQRVGALGGFGQAVPTQYGGAGRGLQYTLQVMEEVSKDCLSTGFCVWCQTVCAWYIQNGESEHLKTALCPRWQAGKCWPGQDSLIP